MLLSLLFACQAPPTQPVATIFPPEPSTLDELQANTSTPSTDPNGDPVSYRYAWFVDGAAAEGQTGQTVAPEHTSKGQVWKVLITPTDGMESGETGYSPEVTILNSAPELVLELGEALSTEDLVATLETSDADGDELVTTVSWTVEGEDAGIDTLSVPASATTSGETWEIRVQVDDGEALSEASASVLVGNTEPELLSAVLGPEPASVADTLLLEVEASDEDGDELELVVRFYVEDEMVQEGYGLELSSEHFERDDEVWATVVASDGFSETEALESNHLLIANAAPPTPTVRIDPEDPHEQLDDLICIWSAEDTDADGEALELEVSWDVDGTPYTEATTTWFAGDTVPAGVALEDEVWTCTATLSDGTDSSEASASVEVLFACSDEGLFDSTEVESTPGEPSAQLADADGDGHLDLMLCDTIGGLEIHWGGGSGGWSSTSSPGYNAAVSCPAVGDIDNDGNTDLFWVSEDGTALHWMLGDGLRSFGNFKNASNSYAASALGVVDGDLDGRLDLLMTVEELGCLAVRYAASGTAYDAATCLISQTGPFDVGDLDGDGYGEIVQIAEGDLKIYGFDSSGSGSLATWAVLDSPSIEELEGLEVDDVDGDGDLDVLAWGTDGDGRLLLARYLGDGSGDAATFRECLVAELDEAPDAAGDIDEDGLPDMVTVDGCAECTSSWTTHILQ